MDQKKPSDKALKMPQNVQRGVETDFQNGEAPADEKGGFKDAGLKEPTRYGDWDVKGRCSDF